MMKPRTAIIAGVIVLIATTVGWMGWWAAGRWGEPFWAERLRAQPRWEGGASVARERGGEPAEQAHSALRRIMNELAILPRWTRAEAAELVEFLRVPSRAPGPEPTAEENRAHTVAQMAEAVVAERFNIGAPIDADAVQMLSAAIVARLKSPYWLDRMSAVTSLTYSGLALDAEIRRAVEAARQDPNPDVASNARQQLAALDTHAGEWAMFVRVRGY